MLLSDMRSTYLEKYLAIANP